MKEIRTVITAVNEPLRYDAIVNQLLNAGWVLTKRAIISVEGEPNEVGSCAIIQGLYAELERNKPHFEEITL